MTSRTKPPDIETGSHDGQRHRPRLTDEGRLPFGSNIGIVEHRGSLVHSGFILEYYTTQPAPTQWIAVGLLGSTRSHQNAPATNTLLIGVGATEVLAIEDLTSRLFNAGPLKLGAPATVGGH